MDNRFLLTLETNFIHNDRAMHRFFVPTGLIKCDSINLTGDTAYQIIRVLRLKPGDRVTLLDDSGWEYKVVLANFARESVQGKVVKKERGTGEPEVMVTLYQALLKTYKFEFVLQKGVELGVTEFIPFLSERCVVKKPSDDRIERWRAVIREAAEQSGRSRLPILNEVSEFRDACEQVSQPAVILWEGEKLNSLSKTLKSQPFNKSRQLNIFIGPEGGFSPDEIEVARQHNIIPVGLGKRILRAETAGLVAVSAIMYETGELG